MRSRVADRHVRWVMTAIVVLFLASALVSVAAVSIQGTRNADAAADEILDRIGDRTADLIAGQLQPAVVALSQMAIAMDEGVGTSVATMEHMLAAQLVTLPELSGAFLAFPDGSFHFVRRQGSDLVLKRITMADGGRSVQESVLGDRLRPTGLSEIDDDFDALSRPWYRAAVQAPGSTIWTEPYVFFSSQQPGVTAAAAVVDDAGQVRAVAGLDSTLTSLSQSVENLPIDAAAEAFIVADDRVIAAPSGQAVVTTDASDALTLVTASDLGLDASNQGRVVAASLGRDELPDWSIVVRTEDIAFVETVRGQTRIALGAVALAVAIGLALLIVIGVRLRRPLNELATLAGRDPLTDVPNRRALLEFGHAAVRRATRDGPDVTVAMLDVDYFKDVNDRHGHAVGDDALRRLGAGLARSVRPSDIVGRYGGDEFLVILVGTDAVAAREALDRVRRSAEQELRAEAETADCTISIGVATRRGREVDITTLIAEADAALLAAKGDRDADEPRSSATARSTLPS